MPAINLVILRKQTTEVSEYFFEPQRFIFHFIQLMDFYSNRTIKPGKTIGSNAQIKTYKVQDPILRTLFSKLSPLASKNPETTLKLANLLWDENIFETRILAIRLLSSLPAEKNLTTLKIIEKWVRKCREDDLLIEFAEYPLMTIQEENWKEYLSTINKWLRSKSATLNHMALESINTLLKEKVVVDLPPLFKTLKSLFAQPPFALRSQMNPIFKSLIRQSPNEIMYLIRNISETQKKKNKNFVWLLKQNLEFIPEEYQSLVEIIISKK